MSETADNTESTTSSTETSAEGVETSTTGTTETSVAPAPDEGLTGVEAAMARAQARTDGDNLEEGGDASHPQNTESGEEAGTETAGGEDDSSSDSTVEIPADWPQDRREAVEGLPVEAQQIVLSVSQDMEAGLTQSLQTITDIKEQHQGIVDSMQEHGFTGERVSEVLNAAAAFDADPQGTLEKLALEAGVDLFFSAEEADGRPSEEVLADPAAYQKWVFEKTQKDIAKAQAHETKVKAESERKATSEARLQDEFKLAEENIPNFAEHKPAVIAKLQDLSEGASVQDAYKLASYDALFEMAEKGQKAEAEVVTLKTELETLQKNGTQLVTGAPNLSEAEEAKLAAMDPASRAAHKAQLRINAQR